MQPFNDMSDRGWTRLATSSAQVATRELCIPPIILHLGPVPCREQLHAYSLDARV